MAWNIQQPLSRRIESMVANIHAYGLHGPSIRAAFVILPAMSTHVMNPPVTAIQEYSLETGELAYCAWLVAIAHGDEDAFRVFYDSTVGKVYHLALRITGMPDTAEEVVTLVYLQVWRDAARYDALRGKVLTWLLTLCRSRTLDYLRHRDRAESHPEPESLRPDLYTGDNDPQDLLEILQTNTAIHTALRTLTATQRQLIALAFFKGLSHQEIACSSGLPLGSVKTHIHKAMELLRKALNGHPPHSKS